MQKAKRIIIIGDITNKRIKMFIDQMHKLAKGFVRLGHDARLLSYCNTIQQLSPFKSKTITRLLYKSKTDDLLAEQIKNYRPDIIYISFARILDAETIIKFRKAAPHAVFIGGDGDPWPKLQPGRIETAKQLDILTATNDGQFLQDYRDEGLKNCVFMPNMCDPDIDHRYEVEDKWKSDLLWTGKLNHHADATETFRAQLVEKVEESKYNSAIYGCLNKPKIAGFDYLYAISGAKIGVNANAYQTVRFCHSDRLLHYLACGTFVLAKHIKDAELLYQDGIHLKYFNSIEEFFDIVKWYLEHENQRKKIADAGMQWVHQEYNSTKIAQYMLDLIETGTYKAPWVH